MEKKASDFRYNTGETKVPWAAVGENYNAQDLMTIIRFMMKGKGEAYDEALKTVEKDVLALDKVSAPRQSCRWTWRLARPRICATNICTPLALHF